MSLVAPALDWLADRSPVPVPTEHEQGVETAAAFLSALYAPADRVLVETDSPYLAPVPHRGRPNEPANVVHVVAALARARNGDAAELAEQIDANAARCFGL